MLMSFPAYDLAVIHLKNAVQAALFNEGRFDIAPTSDKVAARATKDWTIAGRFCRNA